MYQLWRAQKKIIINIGSRAADFANVANAEFPFYAALKAKQDNFCRTKFGHPWIINLKPGTVATSSTEQSDRPKMKVESITKVLDFVFSNSDDFKVRSITFTPW
jgi:NAD(P)-dependent dehydrogenase (short-subunit alcohol dehydrogenase family)